MAKVINFLEQDPNLSSETEKYETPIPSRQFIISFLEKQTKALTHYELCQHLSVKGSQKETALKHRLKAMVRDCELIKLNEGYAVIPDDEPIQGSVSFRKDGFATLYDVENQRLVWLSFVEKQACLPNDTILVKVNRFDHEGRPFGKIIEVVEKAPQLVVGKLIQKKDVWLVKPLSDAYPVSQISVKKYHSDYAAGDIVTIQVLRSTVNGNTAQGNLKECLGAQNTPSLVVDVAMRQFDIPHEFARPVKAEAKKIYSQKKPPAPQATREDLTHLPFVTIDGEDARDFDDAVYVKPARNGNYQLYVAIADVSAYVKPQTALDESAQARGNSVYFPGRVIPMLPHELADDLCSLRPDVPRLVLVAIMTINPDGEMVRSRFTEALIQSHARLTYTKVNAVLDGDESMRHALKDRLSDLMHLETVFQRLLTKRYERGAIDFETNENRLILNETGDIREIIPTKRNNAHRLIEECMLAANVAAARFLKRHKAPVLYRCHDAPTADKRETLTKYLHGMRLTLPNAKAPTSKDFNSLMQQIKSRPDAHVIQVMMLRSLSQAVYSPDNIGHFGLAYDAYVHFTSPIRRYADLQVHRQIKAILSGESFDKTKRSVMTKKLTALGQHVSMTERRADDATRQATMTLKCRYVENFVGKQFTGTVAAVTNFGLFVELDDLWVEGLIHVTKLPNDFYLFDPASNALTGESNRQSFALGDRLDVLISRVDVPLRRIDLALIDPNATDDTVRAKPEKHRKRAPQGNGKKSSNQKPKKASRRRSRRK